MAYWGMTLTGKSKVRREKPALGQFGPTHVTHGLPRKPQGPLR